MKKAMVISIFCAVFLSACGNVTESAKSAETSAVSQTTTAVTVSTVTSAKEEKDTSETTTTTKKSSQTVSKTAKACNYHAETADNYSADNNPKACNKTAKYRAVV